MERELSFTQISPDRDAAIFLGKRARHEDKHK
jgi:hypothetical protein